MTRDDPVNDIARAIMRLRAAFRKHHIPAPDIMAYSDQKQAFDARCALHATVIANDIGGLGPIRAGPGPLSKYAPYRDELAGMTIKWDSQPKDDFEL